MSREEERIWRNETSQSETNQNKMACYGANETAAEAAGETEAETKRAESRYA